MRALNLEQLREVLFDSIMSGMSIRDIFSEIYNCIKLPLNYFDTSFKLVANAFPRPFYFEAWESMAQNEGASDEVVLNSNYLNYQEKMYLMGKSSIFDYGNTADYPQACGPVMLDGVLVGYMGTMIEDAVPAQVVAANDIICDAIAIVMRNSGDDNRSSKHFTKDSLNRYLISGKLTDFSESAFLSIYPSPYICAVVYTVETSKSTLEYIKGTLCTEGSGFLGALSDDSSVRFLLYSKNRKDHKEQLNALVSAVEKYKLICGISDRFCSPLDLDIGIRQAMLSISVGFREDGPPKQIFEFNEMYLKIVLYAAFEKLGPSSILTPSVKALFDDASAGCIYRETLSRYFDSMQRSAAAAQALNIHKNTVLSRLSKIEELTGCDFHNPEETIGVWLQTEFRNIADSMEAK